MKYFAMLLTLMVLSSPTICRAEYPHQLTDACKHAYSNSNDAAIKEAAEFISDSQDDYDYKSIDAMTLEIRAGKHLKAWDQPKYLDLINVAICNVIGDSPDDVCGKDPSNPTLLTLPQIKKFLINKGLPNYYKTNPDDAIRAYWQ